MAKAKPTLAKAILANGKTIEYFTDKIGEGAMKEVYLTKDKLSVVCLYKNQNGSLDKNRLQRLERIIGNYNPTVGTNGDYFKQILCWPTDIVIKPRLGIITPIYPANYFFSSGDLAGKEKESTWFVRPKLRSRLPEVECGSLMNYFQICIRFARTIKRLHLAGLVHSDLSNKNVLVDPTSGQCLVIDMDSLVVPGLFPPDVLGTRGYIAPEVLSTIHLPLNDPNRQQPSIATDQHALAVLIYQYLLGRHPLEGPKTYPAASAEEQERLEIGSNALFIEHPTDTSNCPTDLKISYTTLGRHLSKLFETAFIQGLHSPNDRPAAIEWERALVKTWDTLIPCDNPKCPSHWFVLHDTNNVTCPFCGAKPKSSIPILWLSSQRRSGHWLPDGQVVIYDKLWLFKWHAFDNAFPGEDADRTPQAYCVFDQGKWLLINQNLTSLTSPSGTKVAPGQAIELQDGTTFMFSQNDAHGRMVKVQIIEANNVQLPGIQPTDIFALLNRYYEYMISRFYSNRN